MQVGIQNKYLLVSATDEAQLQDNIHATELMSSMATSSTTSVYFFRLLCISSRRHLRSTSQRTEARGLCVACTTSVQQLSVLTDSSQRVLEDVSGDIQIFRAQLLPFVNPSSPTAFQY